MSSMFRPEPFRSTSFRVALLYTAFFLGSVLAILGITYVAASSEMAGILRSGTGAAQEQAIGCQEPRFEHSEDKENDNPALLTNREQKEQKGDSAELPSLAAIPRPYCHPCPKLDEVP